MLTVGAIGSLHPDVARAKPNSSETDLPDFRHPPAPTNSLYGMPKDIGDISDEFRTQMRDVFGYSQILFKATNSRVKKTNQPLGYHVAKAKINLKRVLFEQLDINNKINEVINGYKEIAAATPEDSDPHKDRRQADAEVIARQLEMVKMTFKHRMTEFDILDIETDLQSVRENLTGKRAKLKDPEPILKAMEEDLKDGGYLDETTCESEKVTKFAEAKEKFMKQGVATTKQILGTKEIKPEMPAAEKKAAEAENREKIKAFFIKFGKNLLKTCKDILPEGSESYIASMADQFTISSRPGHMAFYSSFTGEGEDDFSGNIELGEAIKSFPQIIHIIVHEFILGHHLRCLYAHKVKTKGSLAKEFDFKALYTSLSVAECAIAEGLYHQLIKKGYIENALKETLGDQYSDDIMLDNKIFAKLRLLSKIAMSNAGIKLHLRGQDPDQVKAEINYAMTKKDALMGAISNAWNSMTNNPAYELGPDLIAELVLAIGLKDAIHFLFHQDGVVDLKILNNKITEARLGWLELFALRLAPPNSEPTTQSA